MKPMIRIAVVAVCVAKQTFTATVVVNDSASGSSTTNEGRPRDPMRERA